jgi:GTPase SAR1 family protein
MYHLWDFAGQEVYHSTHTFFISRRSLFLVMFDTSRPFETSAKSLEYWLRLLSTRAPDCPIMLVSTRMDDKACTEEHIRNIGVRATFPFP